MISHIFFAYRVIVLITGIYTVTQIKILEDKKKYLSSFFTFYLFFTVLVNFDIIYTYTKINSLINQSNVNLYFIMFIFTLIHIILILGYKTYNMLYNKKWTKKIKVITVTILVLLFSLLVSMIFNNKLLLSISRVLYIILFLYLIFECIKYFNIIKLKEDRLFALVFILTAILGFSRQLLFVIKALKGFPVTSYTMFESFLTITAYGVLSIFIIYIRKKYLILVKPLLNEELLKSEGFTPKEVEVLNYIKENLSNKKISELLNISISTTKNHISNIYSKMEISNRLELLNLLKKYY